MTLPTTSHNTVLLVEPELERVRLLRSLLSEQQERRLDLFHVESVAVAAEVLRQQPVDALLVDLACPGAGPGSLRDLLAIARGIPVFVLCTADAETVGVEALEMGASDYLTDRHLSGLLLARMLGRGIDRCVAERRLSAREEHLRLALEAGQMGSWEWDLQTDALLWSPELEALHGLRRGTGCAVASGYLQYVHPLDRELVQSLLDRIVHGRPNRASLQYRVVLPDGTTRHLEGRGRLLQTADGRGPRMIGVAMDVTERREAEEAAHESERLFRELAENIDAVFWMYDVRDQRHLYANQYFRELWDQGFDELQGNAALWLERIHPHDRARVEAHLPAFYRGEGNLEYRVLRPNGQVRWIRDRSFPIRDRDGELYRVGGIAEDVTERRAASESLREALQRLRTMIESSPAGIVTIDMDLNVTTWNPAAERIFGWKKEEVLGRPVPLIPEERRGEQAYLMERLRSGVTVAELQSQRLRRDGSLVEVQISAAPLLDGTGQMSGVLVVLNDVSERVRAADELRRREEHFRALVENVQDVVTIVDAEGTVRYVSPAFERVTGYAAEQRIGGSAFERLHPEDVEAAREVFARLASTPGSVGRVEARLQHRNGSWHIVDLFGQNLLHDPAVNGIVVTYRDITEQRRLEEQLRHAQKMEAIGRLAGGVAHDFNNLLTVISGNTALIQQMLGTRSEIAEELEEVRHAVERAEQLTRQLLAFSRKQILDLRPVDLNEWLEYAGKLVRRVIGEDIQIHFDYGEAVGTVRVDTGQLDQVLINLAVNARDAMSQGGELRISTATVTVDEEDAGAHPDGMTPGRYAVLSVSDTGHGMSAKTIARVFEPFFTTKPQGKGTGLGLSTVYGIVQQSGGYVRVSSAPGEGSTFRVFLPHDGAEAPAGEGDGQQPAGRVASETVLLVEDEAAVRRVLGKALRQRGYQVIEAHDGVLALEFADEHADSIDVVVTDVVMPRMSGLEVIRRLRARHPHIRALCMSGYSNETHELHTQIEDGLAVLQKPVRPEELCRAIGDLLPVRSAG